jgi:hypothetical protein
VKLNGPEAALRVFVTRDVPDLEKDPVNDRKGDLTGPRLETADWLLAARQRLPKSPASDFQN